MNYYTRQLVLLLILITLAFFSKPIIAADTNTVSSTVVTNNTPPTANSPSVVVNNSDVCKTAGPTGTGTEGVDTEIGPYITEYICAEGRKFKDMWCQEGSASCLNGCKNGACICDETNVMTRDDCPTGYTCQNGACI